MADEFERRLLAHYAPLPPAAPDERGSRNVTDLLNQYGVTPYPESGTEMPREGGRHPSFARAYDQSWRDRLASAVTGDERDALRRLLAFRLFGSSGLGPSADPNTPWRALPVAAPAVDAAEAAYNDQHGRFAAKALDTGLEGWGVASLPGVLARTAVKPPLPRREAFEVPIMKGGQPVGRVSGDVAGDRAYVSAAFLRGPGDVPMANTIGYPEMRRVFNAIREQFPQTARVQADRISGARHGRAQKVGRTADDTTDTIKQTLWEPGNIVDEAVGTVDRLSKGRFAESRFGDRIYDKMMATQGSPRVSNSLDMSLTPEWLRTLNEYGRRGTR